MEVGLVPLNRSVSENETIQVCAEITAGLLGCNITVPLVVEQGSALGKSERMLRYCLPKLVQGGHN